MTNKDLIVAEPKLTIKQRKFLKLYFETGNGVKAAMGSYDCEGNYFTAGAIASENLKKLKNPIKTYMEAKGFSLQVLLGVLAGGLNAKRTISAINTDKQATGGTTDFIEVPDFAVRHKYLETAARWLEVEPKQSPQLPDNLKRKLTVEEFFTEENK